MLIIPFNALGIENSGVVMEHIRAFQKVARAMDTVIALRPVSAYAHQYLVNGCPTKPFCLKNKTVKDGGPLSGVVPENPAFGEFNHKSQREQFQYKKDLQYAQSTDKDLKYIPFSIDVNQFNKLPGITQIGMTGDKMDYEITWEQNGKKMTAYAKKSEKRSDLLFLYEDKEGLNPIKVMGKAVTTSEVTENGSKKDILRYKPVTADYDLFAVCPPKEKVSHRTDKPGVPVQSGLKRSASAPNLNKVLPEEDPLGGNWPQRIKDIVALMNSAVCNEPNSNRRLEESSQVVHHNALFFNPFADEIEKNLPAIIILPNKQALPQLIPNSGPDDMDPPDFLVIEHPHELTLVRDYLKQNGYSWPTHEAYKDIAPAFSDKEKANMQNFVDNRKKTINEYYKAPANNNNNVPSSSAQEVDPTAKYRQMVMAVRELQKEKLKKQTESPDVQSANPQKI